MNKIDRRIKYILMIDTETANTSTDSGVDPSSALVYDIGFAVADKRGKIYEKFSFIIYDTFFLMQDVMQSAYYANKIPQYLDGIKSGKYKIANFLTVRKIIAKVMRKYNIDTICAHNAYFDITALNASTRYLTKSAIRYFFPHGTIVWDTMKMAGSTICKQKAYRYFCDNNAYLTARGQVRKTAEILYRYVSGDNSFVEEHTALADVYAECQILAKCFRQHKKMNKELFSKKV